LFYEIVFADAFIVIIFHKAVQRRRQGVVVYSVTTLLQIFHMLVKNFENRSLFGDMNKRLQLTFLGNPHI